jgi:signal transduction histidine kinase
MGEEGENVMFNRLSLKMGALFFVFILIIGGLLYFILYINLANERINEIINNLLARGNTHSDVLEDHFDETTMNHVGLMESASDFVVIITDVKGDILVQSNPLEKEMETVIKRTDYNQIPPEGVVIEDNWKEKQYIATDSPITIDGEHRGHVFMFANSKQVRSILDQLSNHFKFIGFITVGITIITIFILSRFITSPVVKMKRATEQLSIGNNQVELHTERNDELGELAKSIQSLSNDLDRLKNERKEFLASISHELRTPLTYIKGYADIIHRRSLSEQELIEYIEIIREETEQLSKLIKHLFELAKMDQYSFVINRELVTLKTLIASIIDLIQPVIQQKNISVSLQCPYYIKAFVDPHRFQQVILNILDNAVKHSPKGSVITIEVREQREFITITVLDHGEGIPKQDLPFVFDRLYRVDKSRSRKSGGSGLGLAIAREIVESHGGSMRINSKFGEGTDVLIQLPIISKKI